MTSLKLALCLACQFVSLNLLCCKGKNTKSSQRTINRLKNKNKKRDTENGKGTKNKKTMMQFSVETIIILH